MVQIETAFATLGDPQKRAAYDAQFAESDHALDVDDDAEVGRYNMQQHLTFCDKK